VFGSIMGSSEQVKESIIALNRAAGFVRTELGKRVRLRHTPELVFKLDSSIEQGVRIAALLDEVLEQEHREQEKE
ncbi:MAG TPA: 30S ribosome-binding factor RbfA, partial [Desulfobacteria bacterium]|nr:30S ribosome-binding factor RbfA [Desulfobacteria bacterium]